MQVFFKAFPSPVLTNPATPALKYPSKREHTRDIPSSSLKHPYI